MDQLIQDKLSKEEIFETLHQFITEVIGEEFVEEMDITPSSSFTKDLEMDSIEIVAFSEKVKNHFGSNIDFTGWLSNMDLDEIIQLKLENIINYIQECQ
ncbi:acyl carrier protein [Dyadobacter sp. BE34]|uniref:Acyl carrier protein n=1 Tax=Dyadobacter fermentans TaxID=94254 RepID=A0ABU1R558_9BACT|nr:MULTISPECIES: phosphopantetheine-binding protein [Dyadobacter]MDR6808549.1 acyl carrier protein [Dyadobacter fermentans]MDR7046292.1 acyl carrier protein [Dyadobacter sp. BE242]MDR7200605.1 acyl carrier protein [Dyadobacter sp. BE34]MDR7218565.1 acyl carrier protein [Dyadobacter sp. BE31]MDR7266495.1 acyl carrier protein [Dyadobacter sp. BE32]